MNGVARGNSGTDALTESAIREQVHSRTPILLRFRVELPSVTATGRWRERGRSALRDQSDA
jgi:hypothetical protein